MNYTELTAAIVAYTENTEFTATETDRFIRQAEQRIYNEVNLPLERKTVTSTLTIGDPSFSLQADFLSCFEFSITLVSGRVVYLINKDVNFLREAYPVAATQGQPVCYAQDSSSTFQVAPTPDLAYATTLVYYGYPTSIVDASYTWLGNNFDSVLLYGALLEAGTYMKYDEVEMKNYKERYAEAIKQLKVLAEGKNRQDTYRSGQARYPVR